MNSFDDAQEKQKTKKLDRLFRNFRVLNHQDEPKSNRLVQAGFGVFKFFRVFGQNKVFKFPGAQSDQGLKGVTVGFYPVPKHRPLVVVIIDNEHQI